MTHGQSNDAPPGYRDTVLVGAGATSRVYRAREITSGRLFALKRLNPHYVRESSALARFRRELDALSQLEVPGIVDVHEVTSWRGDPTLVMDFISGEDLKERIDRVGPLPTEEVESIARAMFRILDETHAAGIVHRDVKPQNIRIGPDGSVYLLDFGSARLDAASSLTTTGTTVGTPTYMAPELFSAPVYDPRVDIYGVGATLFEALTGRPHQSADSLAELAYRRNHEDPPPVGSVGEIPERLAQVVDRCLRRDPGQRYGSASLALWALDHPDQERAHALRRARRPPCLHCDEPLAPESTSCATCGSAHPFAFSAGSVHVELESIGQAAPVLDFLVSRFPERGTAEGLAGLGKQLAALSYGPRRLVSFIDKVEAETLQRRLLKVGACTRLCWESSSRLTAVAFGLLVGILLVVAHELALSGRPIAARARFAEVATTFGVAVVVSILWLRVRALHRSRRGILATSGARLPVWPLLNNVAATTLLFCIFLVVSGIGEVWDTFTFRGATWLALAAAGWLLCAAFVFALAAPRLRKGLNPGPGTVYAALRPLGLLPKPPAVVRGGSDAVGFGVILAMLLIPVELVAIEFIAGPFGLADPLVSNVARVGHSLEEPPAVSWRDEMAVRDSSAVRGDRVRLPQWGLALVPPAFAVAMTPLLRRRRRRIRKDAAQMLSAYGSLGEFERPTEPLSRRVERRLGTPRRPSADPFCRQAAQRAADIAHHLPPDGRARLSAGLRALRHIEAQRRAEASLLARCVLETDAEQKLLFDFLRLEGELEAEAARRWWQAQSRSV